MRLTLRDTLTAFPLRRRRTPRVDQQLRENDCGVSVVATMCDLLGRPLPRETIASTLRPGVEGTRLDRIKHFFDTRAFETRYQLLDLADRTALARSLSSAAPCIAVVRSRVSATLHYVVVERARGDTLHVLDPADGSHARWTLADFSQRAERIEWQLPEGATRERAWRLAEEELTRRGVRVSPRPAAHEASEIYNKLAYFTHLRTRYGFRTDDAEGAFLRDLLAEDHGDIVPPRFRAFGAGGETATVRAPVVLAVREPRAGDSAQETTAADGAAPGPLRRLLREVGSLRRVWYVFLVTALISSVTTHAAVFIAQLLVDDVLPQYEMGALVGFAIGLAAFRLFDLCTYAYTKFVAMHLSLALDRFFLGRFGDLMLESRLNVLHAFTRGDLIERVGDSLKLKGFFTRFVARILVNAVVSLNSLVILFALDWRISFVVVSGAAALLVLLALATPVLRQTEMRRFRAKAALFSRLIETIDGAQPIRALSIGDHFRREIATRIEAYNAAQRRGKLLDLANGTATSALAAAMGIGVLILCARRVIVDESMSLGQLLTFTALSSKIFSSLSALLEENLDLQEHLVILRRYFDFERPPARRVVAGEPLRVRELAADRLACAYDGAPVLEAASVTLQRGETVLLRGANGSGKSTLVRILAGLQDATSGDVLVNGASRRLYDERELHDRVVLVSAEDTLFNDTLRFNLTLGRQHATRTLIDYAKRVRLYDAIVSHPAHLDRVIEEGGRNLSAGQRRKVLVLRALLAGADFLILDEVFRGIDDASQTAIAEFLREFSELGLLVISHETLAALHVDRLLEMRDGHLVERRRGAESPAATLEWGDQRWMSSA